MVLPRPLLSERPQRRLHSLALPLRNQLLPHYSLNPPRLPSNPCSEPLPPRQEVSPSLLEIPPLPLALPLDPSPSPLPLPLSPPPLDSARLLPLLLPRLPPSHPRSLVSARRRPLLHRPLRACLAHPPPPHQLREDSLASEMRTEHRTEEAKNPPWVSLALPLLHRLPLLPLPSLHRHRYLERNQRPQDCLARPLRRRRPLPLPLLLYSARNQPPPPLPLHRRCLARNQLPPPVSFSYSVCESRLIFATAGGFAFGAAPPPAAAPLSLGLGTKPAAPSPLSLGALSAPKPAVGAPLVPATTATAPVPSQLRGKSLDEIVNTWSGELEERTRDFVEIAGEVREWDRVLRKNGEQVRRSFLLPFPPY